MKTKGFKLKLSDRFQWLAKDADGAWAMFTEKPEWKPLSEMWMDGDMHLMIWGTFDKPEFLGKAKDSLHVRKKNRWVLNKEE